VLEALEDDLDLDRPLRVAVPPARVLREGDGAAQSAAERLLGGLGHGRSTELEGFVSVP